MGLGAFGLTGKLGEGGMGEVWRGVHRTQGTEVAIKLLSPRHRLDDGRVRALLAEVRAAAALTHPHVVTVYDHGQLDPEEAAALGVTMKHWTPWLAMELCDRGTLKDFEGALDWPQLRLVLLQLLDALAHAHARGVVHRDIKPSNVLFTGEPAQVKLSDFGMVFAVRREGAEEPLYGGTPRYMAPEQVDGQWRNQGPWTDLYSLGCMAWSLATGDLPFRGKSAVVMQAHLSRSPPAFVPKIPVPDGFEDWLRRLMRKAPHDRYRFAADAAWALMRLGSAGMDFPQTPTNSDPVLAELSTMVDEPPTVTLVLDETGSGSLGTDPAANRMRRPMPLSWRRTGATAPGAQLRGVGLGLYGLREIPLVGRQQERDRLWAALSAVTGDSQPRAAMIRGPDGAGKSRLARWLVERAHEVGAATSTTLLHSHPRAPGDGLVGMVRRLLRCRRLPRAEVANRIRSIALEMDPDTGLTLLEWILHRGDGDAGFAERRAVIELLHGYARGRTVILWVEDAQWGPGSVAFVSELLDHFKDMPVLAVLTVGEGEDLPMLEGRPEVALLDLDPLSPADTRTLVRQLLGVKPEVAAMVEARCEGNPMFAVQLVGDWVARGFLTVSDEAFDLRDGQVPEIPDALHETWGSQVRRALSARTEQDRWAIERAAMLGRTVLQADWEAACQGTELFPARNLVEHLAREGLVTIDEDHWSFAHQLLVESLIRQAEEGRRANGHRAAIAQMRVDQARPMLHAGRFAHALAALRGAEDFFDAAPDLAAQGHRMLGAALRHVGASHRARAHLNKAVAAAAELGDPGEASLAQLELGDLEREAGRPDEALKWLHAAMLGPGDNRGDGLVRMGRAHHEAGRLSDASRCLDAALSILRATGARRSEADALLGLGDVARESGEPQRAIDRYTEALRIGLQLDVLAVQARAMARLGTAYTDRGDRARAHKSYAAALDLSRRCGLPRGAAAVLVEQARMQRDEGRLGRAADLYRQAEQLYQRVDSHRGQLVVDIGRALLMFRTGQAEAARRAATEAQEETEALAWLLEPPHTRDRRVLRSELQELNTGADQGT